MASIIIKRIQERAEKLAELRKVIAEKEEACKAELETLKAQRDAVQALLMADMKENGILSQKVSSGDSFSLSKRKGIEITNDTFALKWAIENMAVSVNKTLVAQKLKDAGEIPSGFEIVETEFISVRKAKNNNEEA